jgi:hypothetical protein
MLSPFHGGNAGSNPAGDANKYIACVNRPGSRFHRGDATVRQLSQFAFVLDQRLPRPPSSISVLLLT